MSELLSRFILLVGLGVGMALIQPVSASKGTASVYYAASLQTLNETQIGPAFTRRTGYGYQGEGLGSQLIANEMKGGQIRPDVVEFADPAVNKTLMGSANGGYVKWYADFARTRLVIGFNPSGKYGKLFRRVNHHHLAWYKPLLARGLRFGRTDPQIDPKGYRVLFAFRLAQRLFGLKHFAHRVLGPVENDKEIFPEQNLVAYLQTGQLDAGVFYLSEARTAHIPYISLPQKIDLGYPKYREIYATQHFTNSQGQTFVGAPIIYTITIPKTVQDKPAAVAFVKFVLGKRAARLSADLGLLPTKHVIRGDRRAVPPGI